MRFWSTHPKGRDNKTLFGRIHFLTKSKPSSETLLEVLLLCGFLQSSIYLLSFAVNIRA